MLVVLQWYASKDLSEQNLFAYINNDEEKSLREKLPWFLQTAHSNCRVLYLIACFNGSAFHPHIAKSSKVWIFNFWDEKHFPVFCKNS